MVTIPPFCPNAVCRYHHPKELPRGREKRWYHKDGTYHTKGSRTPVQRFVCRHCGKRFSAHTFSLDYGVKKQLPYRRIFEQLNSGSGIRSLARQLGVTDKVIINRIFRLARQALALHALLRESCTLSEALAADGFESFTVSQYYPNNIHLAAGKETQYLYALDYAHIRRKGRMRDEQRRRREQLEQRWKAPPGDIPRSFTRMLRHIARYRREPSEAHLDLYTDEQQAYRRVIAGEPWIRHRTLPSTAPRTRRNALFAVNYYDREIRKDQSNHTRETVEFSRDVNNAMDRLWMYSAYHNYVKPYRIGVTALKEQSHAERAGIPAAAIRMLWNPFFTRRYFVTHLSLSESEWYSWYRCYATPLKFSAPRFPQYAAA